MKTFNIYCVESCHLENDQQQVMVLGAVYCPKEFSRRIALEIKAIKKNHNLSPTFEIKWIKVSPAKIDFYLEILGYFFKEKNLYFRALIIPDKTKLHHEAFNQDHDTWYYKMYFDLIKAILSPQECYRIYLDVKDSKSGEKALKLHDILCNNKYDFQRQIIEKVQNVRSHEIEQIQLVDLLIGCVLAANRNVELSTAKRALAEKMQQLSGYSLTHTTLLRERKVNLLCWQPREVSNG